MTHGQRHGHGHGHGHGHEWFIRTFLKSIKTRVIILHYTCLSDGTNVTKTSAENAWLSRKSVQQKRSSEPELVHFPSSG